MAMASRKHVIFFLSLIVINKGRVSLASDLIEKKDIPAPESVSAYKHYWQGFSAYEQKIIDTGKQKYQNSWLSIQQIKDKTEKTYTEKELEHLAKAAKKYRDHLENHEFAHNLPYVYLNLAQILLKMGDIRQKIGQGGEGKKQEALEVLSELESKFRDFALKEEALYLKGLIYTSLESDKAALKIWQQLAAIAQNSLYGVHGKIAVGDHFFRKERADDALKQYESARRLLTKIDVPRKDFEKLRIEYRIVWASYRSAKLKKTIKTGMALLAPGRQTFSSEVKEKVEADAVQLLGDSLYENNNNLYTKSTLKRRILSDFSAKIALRIVQNYLANKIYDEIIDIAEFSLDIHPVSKVAPDLLIILSDAYEKIGMEHKKIEALERLALFLPSQSLWRSRQKDHFTLIEKMEKKASNAAFMAASAHYKKGMKTNNPQFFEAAASFYKILLDYEVNGENSQKLRLKRGHAYYYSGQYKKAIMQYELLINNQSVDARILKIASFQTILTLEKLWQKSFAAAEKDGQKPFNHPIVIENLSNLQKAIENFANRFPPKMGTNKPQLAVDALLAGAAAYRDHNKFSLAEKMWQRVLISHPTRGQRSMAIRGIVLSKVDGGTPIEVIETTKRFLRLENWRKLGRPMANELSGILSQAVRVHAGELGNAGKIEQAGSLQQSIAREFKKMPKRAKIYRDGAYQLAMAGKWQEAEKASLDFLNNKFRTHKADMAYLKAKSQEYQLRFFDAAKSYYELAKKYPKHKKANEAAIKAEDLATADSEYRLAGKAAMLSARLSKSHKRKLASLRRAHLHYRNAGDFEDSLDAAKQRENLAKDINDKLMARIDTADCYMSVRSEDLALEEYKKIIESAHQNREKIDNDVFAHVTGRANFHLGQEARAALKDYDILERGEDRKVAAVQKMKYFENMINHFSLASEIGEPQIASKSRFIMGMESDELADNLVMLTADNGMDETASNQIKSYAERLRKIAKSQHSQNLLAQSKNPRAYKNDPWIQKSQLRLKGYLKSKNELESEDITPSVINLNIPQQWSL